MPRRRVRPPAGLLAGLLAGSMLACGDGGPAPGLAEERPAADEAATTRRLIQLTRRALEERHGDGGMLRFNQARHAGCVRAEFAVERGLAADLAVGLFAAPRAYPAWIRFASSTTASDAEKDFRGMSLKLLGVDGEMLFGEASNFDLLLNSHPVLFVGTPRDFAAFIERSLDSDPILFFLDPFDLHLRELRIALAGRQHHASHLEIPYWSTTPYLFGAGRAVKYQARPCGGAATEPVEAPTEGYLRRAMRRRLAAGEACFDFLVQFQTDSLAMPIEDASVRWDESLSPFRKVATVRIPAQAFESPARMELCENLSFNPWRALPEHRPLGGINRVRREVYAELAGFRHRRNRVDYAEPAASDPF